MTALELSERPGWAGLLPAAAELARQIADTDFVPDAFRRKPAAIAACVMYGAELGVGPMTALAKIAVVKGRPAPSAELGRALAIAAGHSLWLDTATTTRVTMSGQRRGEEHVHSVTWTMDDAKRANLTGSASWRQYPRQMLTARATTELLRVMCPDVLGGITVFAEEIDDTTTPTLAAVPAAAAAAEAEPAKPTTRRRAPRTAPTVEQPTTAAVVDVDVDLAGPIPALSPPTVDVPSDDNPITSAQRTALHAGFRAIGIDDRAERLTVAAAIVGHPIGSSNDLTRDEASQVLDAVHAVERGDATIRLDDQAAPAGIVYENG